jgi:hypothetical protein
MQPEAGDHEDLVSLVARAINNMNCYGAVSHPTSVVNEALVLLGDAEPNDVTAEAVYEEAERQLGHWL